MDEVQGELRWSLDSSGEFTVSSAYKMLDQEWKMSKGIGGEPSSQGRSVVFWKKLWSYNIPKRMQVLAWRAFHEGLPVLAGLRKRGCLVIGNCVFCGFKQETVAHVFFECWWARAVWSYFSFTPAGHLGLSAPDWMLRSEEALSRDNFRKFLCGLSCIWDERNSRFHGSQTRNAESVREKVEALLFQLDRLTPSNRFHSLEDCADCFVICDASWKLGETLTGLAAMAVENNIILAVSVRSEVLIRSISEAEGRALVLGMRLAESVFGHKCITLKTDSSVVSMAANTGISKSRYDENWLSESLRYLSKFTSWVVEWVGRDCSRAVDCLAKKARVEGWEWRSSDSIPRMDFLELAGAVALDS